MEKKTSYKDYWDSLIIDELTNSISENHKCELEAWIASSPEHKEYAESVKQTWSTLNIIEIKKMFNYEQGFFQFKRRIKSHQATILRIRKLFSYAAVFIPLLFLSYFSYQYFITKTESSSLITQVITPKGSRVQLILQDSSKIWMNSESSIQYVTQFSQEERRLKASGEIYLEVNRDEKRPFIVEVGGINIRVLGTKFNINAYKENQKIKVALLEGAVELELPDASRTKLRPNETGIYNMQSNQTQIIANSTTKAICWIRNHLIFNGESFEQIAGTLERNFNIKVNIHNDTIKDNCYFGDFVNDETIEQVFDIMSSNNKFTYTIKGNIIDVY